MKHIDLCYHFIREAVDEGKINVQYIPTAKNVSDIFTKALPRPKFEVFIEKLGLAVRGRSYELSTWYSTLIPYLDLSLSYSPITPPMQAYLRLVIIQMFHVVL